MDEIKSARDIALEKVKDIGEATEEERLRWKYVPEGESLAARFLKEGGNLTAELSQYQEMAKRQATEGAIQVLLRNINLPKDELARRTNKRAMEGLKTLKSNKVSVENVYSKIRHIFNHYKEQGEQQRAQAYQALKAEFEARMQQAVQQQMGIPMRMKIDVTSQPQFQEEWRRTQAQLESQYLKLLDEYKQELSQIK